jgi:hypothetical protein
VRSDFSEQRMHFGLAGHTDLDNLDKWMCAGREGRAGQRRSSVSTEAGTTSHEKGSRLSAKGTSIR